MLSFLIYRKRKDDEHGYLLYVLDRKYAPELGVYHSYDIAVYEAPFFRGPTLVLRDVTPEWDLAFRMIETFNRLNLSPIHLKDAVLDMLE